MSSSSDAVQFRFATHGDSLLSKMNALREEHRFCDITLLLVGPQIQPLHFHGHRVVLAASSDFLRDQFLLHEGRAKLSVGVVSSVEVGKRLLLSCYTGLLEVPLRELVSYLTAASALQMSQVVEKCAQAVSQYLSPTLAFLKLERNSEEKEVQQLDISWPGDSLRNQEERDVAQPNSQVIGERKVVMPKVGLSDDAACCLKSEEGGDIHPDHPNKPSCHVHHITGAIRCKLHPPIAVQDHISSTDKQRSAQHEELEHRSQNPDEEAVEEQTEEDEMFLLATQLQECGALVDCLSGAHLPNSRCSGDELTEDSDSVLVQRPYLCRRCDRVFQHLESYVGHLKEHRQYLCLVCGKGFSHKSNLTRHIHVHTGVKPFRCPLCHKTFSQKATLQDHLNLHTGDKPHKCNYCAVHFAHKPGLRRHLKDIHGKSSLQNVLEEAVD